MSTKGLEVTLATRHKISLANKKDRAKINLKIKEYILSLTNNDLPQLTDAAIYAGISEKTLIRYEMSEDEDSEIRLLLDLIRDLQKSKLIENGLYKRYDSRLAGLLLERLHGMQPAPTALSQTNIFGLSPELLADAIEITKKKEKAKLQGK